MICTILAMTAAASLAVMQVRAEAKELATVHVKRADAKLSRAKTKEDIRQVKDLFFSAQRLHFTEEAAAGLKLTEELQLSVDHLLGSHHPTALGLAVASIIIMTITTLVSNRWRRRRWGAGGRGEGEGRAPAAAQDAVVRGRGQRERP